MNKNLTIEWKKQIERPDWDEIKDEPWASPAARYLVSTTGGLVGICEDPDLIMPIIEGGPKTDGQTRFDILCPLEWDGAHVFFNGQDMGTLIFTQQLDPGDYRRGAPPAPIPSYIPPGYNEEEFRERAKGYVQIGRVECASNASWLVDAIHGFGGSSWDETLKQQEDGGDA